MKKNLALILIALAICVSVKAANPVPFSTNVTVTAGSGSFTYPTAGIIKPYSESFRITGISGPCTAGLTNTYRVVDGGITNKLGAGTKVVAAKDAALTITDDWPHFTGAKILIESGDTNTFTATLFGYEE